MKKTRIIGFIYENWLAENRLDLQQNHSLRTRTPEIAYLKNW
jgi:hypothetical protein